MQTLISLANYTPLERRTGVVFLCLHYRDPDGDLSGELLMPCALIFASQGSDPFLFSPSGSEPWLEKMCSLKAQIMCQIDVTPKL